MVTSISPRSRSDTYYVGVSSEGNEGYEPKSLTARTEGTGGTGDYNIGIEVLAPRSFVFSLDSHPLTPFGAEVTSGTINGTTADGGPAGARSLIGTTFTISQIPDYLIPTRAGDAYANVNADGNRVTFEYTGGVNAIVLANGNINIPILPRREHWYHGRTTGPRYHAGDGERDQRLPQQSRDAQSRSGQWSGWSRWTDHASSCPSPWRFVR